MGRRLAHGAAPQPGARGADRQALAQRSRIPFGASGKDKQGCKRVIKYAERPDWNFGFHTGLFAWTVFRYILGLANVIGHEYKLGMVF